MEKSKVTNCMFDSWYNTFKNITFESECISLPPEFISYLLADGIVLPERNVVTNRDNLEGDSDDEVDWESEETTSIPAPAFPELDEKITSCIERLGGAVFPKLNWSSPKDASWISFDNTLKCKEPNDIYLLLKSSDFVTHDLTEPFENCTDCEASNTDDISYKLILRKWRSLHVGMEFRCFVKNNELVGICQRHHTVYFKHIDAQKDEIIKKLQNFYEKKIHRKFPDDSYVFDAYIGNSVELVDFNPFGDPTDALLFSWEILQESEGASTNEYPPEFRYVKEDSIVQGNAFQQFAVPIDFVHLVNGLDPSKFTDLLQMKIQSQHDDSSSEED